jgi:NAD(P)-dependent dehydrogenase (short-subunit alcohol dehydrogenase family)
VDWDLYYGGEKRHKVILPTYPFERQRYWIDFTAKRASEGIQAAVREEKKADISDWFHMVSWERSEPLGFEQTIALEKRECWLVFQSASGHGLSLVDQLRTAGQHIVRVVAGQEYAMLDSDSYALAPDDPEGYKSLFRDLREKGRTPRHIVHLWNLSLEDYDPDLPFYSLLALAQAFGSELESIPIDLMVVTSQIHEVVGDERQMPERATVCGICNVIPKEYPEIKCRMLDLDLASDEPTELERAILAECLEESGETVIAHRGAYRWVRRVKPVHWASEDLPSCLRKNGTYMITGGLGGVGLALAEYLATSVQARLVLVGRTEFPDRHEWNEWLNERPDHEVSGKIRRVEQWEAQGAKVLILSADVSDLRATERMIADAEKAFGEIHGVIHAAGIAGGKLIQLLRREDARRVLAPKVAGTGSLFQCLKDKGLDFLVLCSSQRSLLGAPGAADYCSANAFLDAFALASRSLWRTRTVSIVWDSWQNTGMAKGVEGADVDGEFLRQVAKYSMTLPEGIEAFRRILSSKLPVVVVSTRDWEARVKQHELASTEKVLEFFGKVRTIPTAHARPILSSSYTPPTTKTERTLIEIWQELLGIAPVGVNDNFFELGGDSVVSLQMISRARQAGLQVSIKEALRKQTIAELAALVDEAVPVRGEKAEAIVEVPSSGGNGFSWTPAQIANITAAISKAAAKG